jgi:hypothetical protein
MKSAHLLSLTVSFGLIIACSVTRRHRATSTLKVRDQKVDERRTLLSLFALKDSEPTQPRSFDSQGQDQGHDDIAADTFSELTPMPGPLNKFDRSTVSRRLVVSLIHEPFEDGKWWPADRIVWSDVKVEVKSDSCLAFTSYDRLDTGYEVIDHGNITRNINLSMSGTNKVSSVEGVRPKLETSLTSSAAGGIREVINLRRRIVTAAVAIFDDGKTMRIIREGGIGIDLTGTVVIDVHFRCNRNKTASPVFAIRPALGEEPQPTSESESGASERCRPGLIVAEHSLVAIREPALELDATADSIIRMVVSGAHTVRESDDKVIFERSVAQTSSKIDLNPVLGHLVETEDQDVVKIRTKTLHPKPLQFFEREDAQFFLGWLDDHSHDEFEEATCGWRLVDGVGEDLPADAKLVTKPRLVGYGN